MKISEVQKCTTLKHSASFSEELMAILFLSLVDSGFFGTALGHDRVVLNDEQACLNKNCKKGCLRAYTRSFPFAPAKLECLTSMTGYGTGEL